jgi:predicted RNase H-like nuclease
MVAVGVDGCREGWFAVEIRRADEWDVGIFRNVTSLWARDRDSSLILIDIPIVWTASGLAMPHLDSGRLSK